MFVSSSGRGGRRKGLKAGEEEADRNLGPATASSSSSRRRAPSPAPKRDEQATKATTSNGSRRRRGDASPPASPARPAKKQKKKEKEFAWMDSEDEEEGGGAQSSEEGEKDLPPPPSSPAEVQTFSQMMRYVDSFKRGELLRKSLAECAELSQAAARVRYYDGAFFGDLQSAVMVHLRGKGPKDAPHLIAVLSGLADMNAYNSELFEAAAVSLEQHGGPTLDRPNRRRALEAFSKVKHKTETQIVAFWRSQEAKHRYEEACDEVAASWQKPGSLSQNVGVIF
eukprot:TRINITY_DN13072_c0_g1_i2.p1 TRINITY_DN13072_c0_g1~~TRINITY_DN13072_c0_g1_i2.p1  ORF type:complete len:282 (-),score=66.10 TRINITY_DN13072_c0_g1_i2:174-1019(-)